MLKYILLVLSLFILGCSTPMEKASLYCNDHKNISWVYEGSNFLEGDCKDKTHFTFHKGN